MATFPIQYAERLPSGETGAVRARPVDVDVRMGGPQLQEEYARRGAGLAALGRDIFELAMTIRKQEDAAEYSELKRKFDEAGFATFNAITGNEETDVRLISKLEQDFSGELSKRGNVSNMLRQHINEVMPEWHNSFLNKGLAIRRKNVKDKFELEAENLLGQGNLPEYYKQLNARLALEDISQAEFDFKVANAPNDSILQQMRLAIGNNNPQGVITLAVQLKDASADQMDYRNKLLQMAAQQAAANTDEIQNEITFAMFDNRDKMLPEREALGRQYISRLQTTPGLSAENARVMTNRIENWMTGKERTNDSLIYTNLFRDVTQLHRGIGRTDEIRQKIVNSFPSLDDQHFESLNKYLEETVEEWNADTLRRLEKEAIPHLAPRMSMLEKFMELSATPGISATEKAKYDNLIQRLQEPAKVDADRLALYLDQCRKYIAANPKAPDLYEKGKYIRGTFERYADDQIRQMEKQLESGAFIESPEIIGGIKPEIPIIKSDAEYDALPIGTIYKDPSGNLRRKQ